MKKKIKIPHLKIFSFSNLLLDKLMLNTNLL